MPGKRTNKRQAELYMAERNKGKTQETSAVKAGISERTGRRIEAGEVNPAEHRVRRWRTRKDPFEKIWDAEIVPQLMEHPEFTPQTLFEDLQKRHPQEYSNSRLRTFQRRVRQWKALHGPPREVMFLQEKEAGRMGLSDFTILKDVEITVAGRCFDHRLYHFRLSFSGWCDVKVIIGGESFTALAEGFQNALWKLGGVPREHRTDSLSAAYRNLSREDMEDFTRRYEALCAHYGIVPTRNNRGEGHENGAIESPHGHLKHRIRQALLLRGSSDFDTIEAYRCWIDEIVCGINERNRDRIALERETLLPLPMIRTSDYNEKVVRVTSGSTITVGKVLYTVPSRLIGQTLRLHIFDDRIDGYVGTALALTLPRISIANNRRERHVDYRHVIESLERKPQAFRYSRLREDLLPTERYRMVWEWLDRELPPRDACKRIVGILALAHRFDCEAALEEYLSAEKEKNHVPSLHELQDRFGRKASAIPMVTVPKRSAADYDHLLPGFCKKEEKS